MSTSNFQSSTANEHTDFGKYILRDKLSLNLPNNEIICTRLNDTSFSYKRDSQETDPVKKVIHSQTADFEIGLMPLLPIHVPSYKTDFFFMRFTEQMYISQHSVAEMLISFPIDIGVFLVENDKAGLLDSFSCDMTNSRFALYGPPDNGKLCKYVQIPIEDQSVQQPFVHTQIKLRIANELDEGVMVGKIVFPVTDHKLYYKHSSAVMDGLTATIKSRIGVTVVDTVQNPISGIEGWMQALRDVQVTDYKFSMEKGFD